MSTHLHTYTVHGHTLSKNIKPRIQASQNKCNHSCLQLSKKIPIYKKGLEKINGLRIKERWNQCVNSIVFKYFEKQCAHDLNEVFTNAPESSLQKP